MVRKTAMSGKDSAADCVHGQQHTLAWLHVLSLLSDFRRMKICTAEFAQQHYPRRNIEDEELDAFLCLRGCMNAKNFLRSEE